MYSPTVRRLVAELPNQGRLPEAPSITVENPICGDVLELFIKTENGIITESRFQAAGCPAAIAAGAAITLMVQGKSTEVARQISVEQLIAFLEDLPSHKRHGAEMAIRALKSLISTPVGR
ncbi:MAG TPA: iron-sulfur cluster assembly scaffold protein [Acidobacteriota bacterium]|mgnify:FL=1|nr:iron-sulfur cluster assembly scaffold protein [Acidobacteriota bacterium]